MPEVVEVVQVELVVEPVEPVVVELHQQVFQQETEQLILAVVVLELQTLLVPMQVVVVDQV
tara:strand:+ start:595 stop:777 length:183 start_codon:yes stop_codon:yes gene_type:complete